MEAYRKWIDLRHLPYLQRDNQRSYSGHRLDLYRRRDRVDPRHRPACYERQRLGVINRSFIKNPVVCRLQTAVFYSLFPYIFS